MPLAVDIRNPYLATDIPMHVSSDPLTHHRVAGGDFSMDVNMPGLRDAGQPVAFDAVPTHDAREVRGLVLRGGGTSWVACRSGDPNNGGWAIQIGVQARAEGAEWQTVGTFSVLHLEAIPDSLHPGVEVRVGDSLGVATGRFGGGCSSGPHLHCEASSEGGCTIATVRLGAPLSECAVLFSIARARDDDRPGPELVGATVEAAQLASSLSVYYVAMGRSLPSKAVRCEIYEALALGPAASYRASADQNGALLQALKQRGVAPIARSEIT